MTFKPALTVAAYNRPQSLERLLVSLARAEYPSQDIPLVISVDTGGAHHDAVVEAARSFEWTHGIKRVIVQPENLGVLRHIHALGDFSAEYGSVVRFEDDHSVSCVFYRFAVQALSAYTDDPRIAGISLYALWFNGYSGEPFIPFLDGSDAYFIQIPWSHGQAYTAHQWDRFRSWERESGPSLKPGDPIHEVYQEFDSDDWFPLSTRYLSLTGRYYVFPRSSLVTNWGDRGTHFKQASRYFQVPLQQGQRDWSFSALDVSKAVYDSFMEMTPDCLNRLTDRLAAYDYEVDLYGNKSPAQIKSPYLLTSLHSRLPIMQWGKAAFPLEENIIQNVPGDEIVLSLSEDVQRGWWVRLLMRQAQHDYFHRDHPQGIRRALLYTIVRLIRGLAAGGRGKGL